MTNSVAHLPLSEPAPVGIEVLSLDSPHVAFLLGGSAEDGESAPAPQEVPQPQTRQIATLINDCFWVSLQAEEGRPVKGEIVLCEPEDWWLDEVRLAEAVPLDRKSLVQLLTASPNRAIGARVRDGGVEAWGFPAAASWRRLKVRILGSGSVVASNERRTLILGEGWVTSSDGDALTRVVLNTFRYQEGASFDYLVEAIRSLDAHRHGGGLLFVPHSGWTSGMSVPFRVEPLRSGFLKTAVEHLERAVQAVRNAPHTTFLQGLIRPPTQAELDGLEWRDRANQNVRVVGAWTAIDGFTVLTPDLTVVGFGAKLTTPEDPAAIVRVRALSGTTESVELADLGGTRHQSAARYIAAHPECALFVSSTDGRLSAFAYDSEENRLVVTTDLQYFL